jgi:hypothetical protein
MPIGRMGKPEKGDIRRRKPPLKGKAKKNAQRNSDSKSIEKAKQAKSRRKVPRGARLA